MGQARPPRRAVLVTDPRNRIRKLSRSRGWPGEAAALDAVRLLDTDTASAEIRDLAGCFAVGPNSWAIVRGGRLDSENDGGLYWRDALVLSQTDFAQLRRNPFRAVASAPPDVPDDPYAELPPPALPPKPTLSDDFARLRDLHRARITRPQHGEIDALLAAVLEAEHTLVTRSHWSYDDLEFLILLLPSLLRGSITFHSHATSLPAPPLPRLVLTPLTDDAPFEPQHAAWGHRLPHTRRLISVRARRAATELIAALDELERLYDAHLIYERYVTQFHPQPRPLLDEVESLLRFVGMRSELQRGNAVEALQILERSTVTHGGSEHPEPPYLFDLMRDGFSPTAIGNAVAQRLSRAGGDTATAAFVIEHYSSKRTDRPGEFAEFTRPIDHALRDIALSDHDQDARRIRPLLLLLAASRADPVGLVAALAVPVDHQAIESLGGIDAWLTPEDPGFSLAVRALVTDQEPERVGDALQALQVLRNSLPETSQQIRLVELALAYARWAFQRFPADRWKDAGPIARAAVDLCLAMTSSCRVSLTGAPYSEHVREMLGRSMNPGGPYDVQLHTDAEVFFGLLGVDASRSRLARREIDERGDQLVRIAHERILRVASTATEGVHWSFAMLERVARGEVDPLYQRLAARLLARCAGRSASALLRAFVQEHPYVAPALVANTALREVLTERDLMTVAIIALDAAIRDAISVHDAAAVLALCDRLRAEGIQLGHAQVAGDVAHRLAALLRDLRWNSARPVAAIIASLNRALTPILAPDALPVLRAALTIDPGSAAIEASTNETRELAPRRSRRRSAESLLSRPAAMAALAFFAAACLSLGGLLLLGIAERTIWPALRADRGVATISASERAARAPLNDPQAIDDRLEEARYWAREIEWAFVVDALDDESVAPGLPQAFVWDSLLALAAFRQAERVESDDARRLALLRLSGARATTALTQTTPPASSHAYMRLLRAEACLEGPLPCDSTGISEDLRLAAESGSARVRARARALLQSRDH